ncbi:hypothetical protein ACT7CX_00395 [Bacillus cereus]
MSRVAALSGASDAELQELTPDGEDLGASTSFKCKSGRRRMQYLALAGFQDK